MSLPAADLDSPATSLAPRHRWLAATAWALTVGVWTGGLWAGGLIASLSLLNTTLDHLRTAIVVASVALAISGAVAGLILGALVGLIRGRNRLGVFSFALGPVGALIGAVGGGLSLPTMLLCNRWLHPLASSSLLWGSIGFFIGLFGYHWTHRPVVPSPGGRSGLLSAASWAFSAAFLSGGAWASVLFAARVLFGVVFPSTPVRTDLLLVLVGVGSMLGLIAGTGLGFRSQSGERGVAVPVLGLGGAMFGAFAGGFSLLSVSTAGDQLSPLVSSSLGMATVGFLAGLGGYAVSCWTTVHAEPEFPEEEAADLAPTAKVEWVLRERKRQWRIDRALLRVLPVLLVTVWALIGAALLAPDNVAIALLAVGVLGLSVALVLYRQEDRLEVLERRFRGKPE